MSHVEPRSARTLNQAYRAASGLTQTDFGDGSVLPLELFPGVQVCVQQVAKEIPTVFKNGGKCPQRGAKDPYFSQIDAEEYLFYNSE